MKRALILLITFGWGASFCSSIASAGNEISEKRDKEERLVFRFGISGGETKKFLEGKPEPSSTKTGVAEFRIGYEFPTSVLLDIGVQGLALGSPAKPNSVRASKGRGVSSQRAALSSTSGALYSARIGYKLGRLRTYGGFGLGTIEESLPYLGNGENGYRNERSDLAGPVLGFGFILLKGRDVELELGADVSYLSVNPKSKSSVQSDEQEGDRKEAKVLTHSFGLKLNLFTSGGKDSAHSSSNSVNFYCCSACFRGTGDLPSLAPQLGLEITKALIQAALKIH